MSDNSEANKAKSYSRFSGSVCCVVGCSNSMKKIYEWKNSVCTTHSGILGKDCLISNSPGNS